jgi:hypothetical protein
VPPFTRDLACRACGREYLVSGAFENLRSETETLTQFRCSCGQWMGVFVPGSAEQERLVVSVKAEGRLAVEEKPPGKPA